MQEKLFSYFSIKRVLILWLFITAINLLKPFHIDDTFHIEVAQWIEKNPFKPMSGKINWGFNPNFIHTFNQPPLFFSIMAVWGHYFSYSEVSLHFLLSIFTFLSVYFFSRIYYSITPRKNALGIYLFSLSPALIINQNIMVEMPVLAFILAIMYRLIKPNPKFFDYFIIAILFSFSLLIKYSVLPMFAIVLVAIFIKNRTRFFKYSSLLLIPIFVLLVWSYANYLEYGGIHFLDRPKNELSLFQIGKMSVVLLSTIGAFLPFYFLYFKLNFKHIIILSGATIVFPLLVYWAIIPEPISNVVLYVVFMLAAILAFFHLFKYYIKNGVDKNQLILFSSLVFFSVFLIVFAPFMASRHLLLILPFLILLSMPIFETRHLNTQNAALGISVIFALWMNVSDWQQANFYKKAAKEIAVLIPQKKYTIGHWGWQFYSKKEGFIEYGTDSSKLILGDILIAPNNISKQAINKKINTESFGFYTQPPTFSTFLSGKSFANFYNSSGKRTAWSYSNRAIDTVFFLKVVSISE